MIRSNIGDVIGRLTTAKHKIPLAVEEALRPQRWAKLLRDLAGLTMAQSEAITADEKRFIPDILQTFFSEGSARHMMFSLQSIPVESLIRDMDDPTDFLKQGTEEALLNWVINFKKKSGGDLYADGTAKSDEVIARRVGFAIQADPEPWLKSSNPEGLKYIIGLTNLPADKVSALLQEVLVAWVLFMREYMPQAVLQQIRKSL